MSKRPSELAHYGVKGMRWGVRKDQSSGRKKASALTDSELKQAVSRMNLERNYRNLVTEEKKVNAGPLAKGSRIAGEVLVSAGKVAITAYATKQISNAISSALPAKS